MRKLIVAELIFCTWGLLSISCTRPGYDRTAEEIKGSTELSNANQGAGVTDSSEIQIELDRINQSPILASDSSDTTVGDVSVAIDDYVWQQLGLASEYCNMGVLANRETVWEEAEYYFEKSLAILGELDIDTEADTLSEEAAKYNQILAEVVANYRTTLVSLGRLPSDVFPDVVISRFSDINHIKIDSSEFTKLETYAQEKASYNVPVVFNDRVKTCMLYYQTVARDAVVKYIGRSSKYLPMIEKIFQEYGLPSDLAYLALVESGFNAHAYSWARAMGMWQFIAETGRLYGMERTWWYDERKDPVKATHSAARFLKDLYNEFGSWELALAAYNGGPQRIRNETKKQGTKNFWKLRLKKQTMDYVPFFMAAIMLCKDPGRFGFTDVVYEPEWEYDEVRIDRSLDLKTISLSLGCPVATLQELNPELLKSFTPPNLKHYNLRIPRGSRETFLAAYEEMPPANQTNFIQHKIRRGETIASIARKYGVSEYSILEANRMSKRSKLSAGKSLVVPVESGRDYALSSQKKDPTRDADGDSYVVRGGDTVSDIAKAFGTTPAEIRRLNNLGRQSKIFVGEKLVVGSSGTKTKTGGDGGSSGLGVYIVKEGDTLWNIARRFGVSIANLLKMNNLTSKSQIFPGQKLLISAKNAEVGSSEIYTEAHEIQEFGSSGGQSKMLSY